MHRDWRVLPSGSLFAAVSLALGRYTGHERIAFQLMTGNRMDRQRRAMVGTLTGQGLFQLDLAEGLPFPRLARAAFRAGGQAHRFGFCDPEALAGLLEDTRLARGAWVDLGCYVNDLVSHDYEAEPEPTAAELRGLAGRTVIEDAGGMPNNPTHLDIRLHLTLERDEDMPLTMVCDTRYLPSDAMRQVLSGIERVLVAAVSGESDVAALGEISGITPLRRGPSWVWCGDGWADVAGSRQVWRDVLGANPGELYAEPAPDGGQRLVGYLVGDESVKLDELHRRCLAAIGSRTDARTPGWYRLIGRPPAPAGDPSAWRRAPVLVEADGR
jgi:hypothetical protein